MFGWFFKNKNRDAQISALEALRTNVMIADADLNITNMNPAVMELMREAQADLKKELPHR